MNELPSFLKQTGPAAYTLTLSASFAEQMMLCPAKVSWSRLTGIEAAAPRPGMNYGKAIHIGLEHIYSHMELYRAQALDEAGTLMEKWFAENPQPAENRGKVEFRTLARARQALAAYSAAYPAETWEVIGVEEPFEVELGSFRTVTDEQYRHAIKMEVGLPCATTVTVVFRGIRDLRVKWHDLIWVVDHKTSGEWSDLTVDEGKASFQFMGYAWVERHFVQSAPPQAQAGMLPTGGVIGNYLIARAPYSEGYKPRANSLPRDQFERISYPFSDAQLDEWHERAMRVAQDIWRHWQEGEWDQRSTGCAHWGRCEYYQLCWETDPAYRMSAAMGADYRPRTPSPLDAEDV